MRDFDLGAPSPPPLVSHDDDGHVIYLRSVSKPIAAGLRVSGLAARGPVLARLRRGRISDDLFVAPILQQIALDVLTAPGWPRHLGTVRRHLRDRRDALVAAVREMLPSCRLDVVPAGGMHLWLRLPDHASRRGGDRGGGGPRAGGDAGSGQLPRRAAGVVPAAELRRRGSAALRRAVDILAEVVDGVTVPPVPLRSLARSAWRTSWTSNRTAY